MKNEIFAACLAMLIRSAVSGPLYEPIRNKEMQACKDTFLAEIKSKTSANCAFVVMNCNAEYDDEGRKLIQLSCAEAAKTPESGRKDVRLSGGNCNKNAETGWLFSLFVFFCPTTTVEPVAVANFHTKLETFMNTAVRKVDIYDFVAYLVELFQDLKRSARCLRDGVVKYGYTVRTEILDGDHVNSGLLDMGHSPAMKSYGIWCRKNVEGSELLDGKRVMEIAAGYASRIKENVAAATIERTFEKLCYQGTSRPFRQSTEAKNGLEGAVKKLLKEATGNR